MDFHRAPVTGLLTDIPLHISFSHLQTSCPAKRELDMVFGAILCMGNTPGGRNPPHSLPDFADTRPATLKKALKNIRSDLSLRHPKEA